MSWQSPCPQSLTLASGNPHKLKEFSAILSPFGCAVYSQAQLGLGEAEETGNSFMENALIKMRHASRHTDQAILADDSGIQVDALGGEPGIYSARYASRHGSKLSNMDYLLARLQELPEPYPRACFCCAIAYSAGRAAPALMIESRWSGHLVRSPAGDHGFGYDPIFYLRDYRCTAAQLEPAQKNAISHRGRALRQLLAFFGFAGLARQARRRRSDTA